jgi:NAD(P)H-dependent FMN reductase
MWSAFRVLLLCGSLREGSTNAAVLETARVWAPEGVECVIYDGLARLPHFNPDMDREPLDHEVAALRSAIADADAVLMSTPEYAGALPGSFKNVLDWSVGGGEIYGKPVAWINASTGFAGAVRAHESLRVVLGFVGADIVEPACTHIPVSRQVIGDDGVVEDLQLRRAIVTVLSLLAAHVETRRVRDQHEVE